MAGRVDLESEISDHYGRLVAVEQSQPAPVLNPLTTDNILKLFMSGGSFGALLSDTEGAVFRREVRKDPHAAIRSYRGRVFQDLSWLTLQQQYPGTELLTAISEPATYGHFKGLYGANRKKYPLSPNTLAGISTTDFMIVREVAPQTYRNDHLIEASIADWLGYYKEKYEHFLSHKDAHPDYFAYTTLRFMTLKDVPIELNGHYRFAEVKPGIIDSAEFEEFCDEIAQDLPSVQYALSQLED